MPDYPEWFLDLCRSVTAKRPKTVIDHILEHGHITTEELKDEYGYDHPPRAARDVRELGIPLETFPVEASNDRKIGAYRFGNLSEFRFKRIDGRTAFSRDLPDCCINSYVLVRETPLYNGYFAHWPVRLRFTPSEDELHRRDTCFALLLQHELPLSIAFYATGRI